ncbi:MAG: tRNA-dihydrouridine synthase [Thermoleophilia bacterium]|nr:tRNA-dihydrouridine synthase [Thermoleophilia bacterium]
MIDLSVSLGPLRLSHPLINASGTLDLFEVAAGLGDAILADPPVAAYVPKTVTLKPRPGNDPPRIVEVEAGMLNSIGLPNAGVEAFVADELPRLLALPRPLILNVGGFAPGEYALVAARLRRALQLHLGGGPPDGPSPSSDEIRAAVGGDLPAWTARVGLELNVSCPNVHSGCMSIGADPGETRVAVEGARAEWPGLLVVKLTPNVTNVVPVAQAAAEAGASAISLVNTFKGLVLDRVTLRPYLGGVTGGLSGPAIKPLALRFVYEVAAAVDVPLIGMGGVTSVQDVLEFMACGASAVAVGAAGFRDPWLPARLAAELGLALEGRGWSLSDLVGRAHRR